MKNVSSVLLTALNKHGYNSFMRANEIHWHDPKKRSKVENGKISIQEDGNCFGVLPATLILELMLR